MGARAQIITCIKIENNKIFPFFVVHRQWAEGTDLLLEIMDIMSFIYSNRPYNLNEEYFRDNFEKKLNKKFHLWGDNIFGTDESIKCFFDTEKWKSFDNNLGYAKLMIEMKADGAFTGCLQLLNHDFIPITLNDWREKFLRYDEKNDADAFYSGFKSLMQWYEIDVV